MAPISYYYLISLALVGGILFWLLNLTLLKFKGKTAFGQVYKKGSPEQAKIISLASRKNFIVSISAGLILLINLVLSIVLVLKYGNSDRYVLLFGAPVVVIIMLSIGVVSQRNRFGVRNTDTKSKRTHTKKIGSDDSWLS